jgi:hypothetical protein
MKKILPLLFFIALLRAAEVPRPISGQSLQKSSIQEWKFFDVNSIYCTINSAGPYADYLRTNSSGMYWPRGTMKTSVFTAGLWIIGKHRATQELRTAVMNYSSEFQPGPIISTFNTETNSKASLSNSTDSRYRVYKVNANDNESNIDYKEWPGDLGAPYSDFNGNNQWDPGNDKPKITGDQMLWCVFNDGDSVSHRIIGQTKPMGIEVQASYFGFDSHSPLKNVMYMKFVIINRSDADYDSVFISLWSDTDLGDGGDDMAGYDSTLNLGYVYNGDEFDGGSRGYGTPPPAGGFMLIQGPLVTGIPSGTGRYDGNAISGSKNLSVSSHVVYFGGGFLGWSDPELGSITYAQKAYNYQRGLIGATGLQYVDPHTQKPTPFVFAGDPVNESGWIHSNTATARDVRSMISAGPLTLAKGDTQEIIAAYVIAQGNDRLNSITRLKESAAHARRVAQAGFVIPAVKIIPVFSADSVSFHITTEARSYKATQISVDIKKQANDTLLLSVPLSDTGTDGDSVSGDGIFSGMFRLPISSEPIRIDAHITDHASSVTYWPSLVERQPLSRLRVTSPVIFSDNRNMDGTIQPGESIRYGVSVVNEEMLTFDHLMVHRRPYSGTRLYLGQIPPLGTISTTYDGGASRNYMELSIPSNYNRTTITDQLWITDANENSWPDSVTLYINYSKERVSPTQKVSGRSPFTIDVVVTDKKKVKNNTYSVSGVDSAGWVIGIHIRDSTEQRQIGEMFRISYQYSISENNHIIQETDGFKVNLKSVKWFSEISSSWEPENGGTKISTQIYPAGTPAYLPQKTSVSAGDVPNIAVRFSKVDSVTVDILYGRMVFNNRTYWFPVQGNNRSQRAYLYTNSAYLGFIDIPFVVYDMMSNPPRQLTVVLHRWTSASTLKHWNVNTDQFFVMEAPYSAQGDQFDSSKGGIHLLPSLISSVSFPFYYRINLTPNITPFMDTLDLQVFCTPSLSYRDIVTFKPAEYSIKTADLPTSFSLFQNYPNPFNPSTIIQYTIPLRSQVLIDVYDILGRRVRTLLNEVRDAGTYEIEWNGRDDSGIPVSSGLYLYRFSSEGTNIIKKMMLIK